jgi:hypothetical protein
MQRRCHLGAAYSTFELSGDWLQIGQQLFIILGPATAQVVNGKYIGCVRILAVPLG